MFGMSFGELAVIVIFGLIVMGPKELPKVLRKLGQWSGKLRRMAADMRVQSGIDDVLREGGLHEDINEIRKLARGELDGVVRAARVTPPSLATPATVSNDAPVAPVPTATAEPVYIAREREYPREGADSYGALPDTALVYTDFPKSALADDALYTTGEATVAAATEPAAIAS
jgi:sec-independent protein translocase protein TatB